MLPCSLFLKRLRKGESHAWLLRGSWQSSGRDGFILPYYAVCSLSRILYWVTSRLTSSALPLSWSSAKIMTSSRPNDFVFRKSRFSGKPTPSSLTLNSISILLIEQMDMLIFPSLSCGNAYFRELKNSSLMINPQWVAKLSPDDTSSTSIFNEILFVSILWDLNRPFTRLHGHLLVTMACHHHKREGGAGLPPPSPDECRSRKCNQAVGDHKN